MLVNLCGLSKVDIQNWVRDPRNVYIGRKSRYLEESKWGNPYRMSDINSREERERVVQKFEQYLRNNQVLLGDIEELAGKNLGCFCYPEACHGNVLEKVLSELTRKGPENKTPTPKPKHNPTRLVLFLYVCPTRVNMGNGQTQFFL